MAVVNKYPSSFGQLIEENGVYSLQRPDGTIRKFDINNATAEELQAFEEGMAVGEVNYKLENGILVQKSGQLDGQNLGSQATPNYSSVGQGQSQGKQKVLLPNQGTPNMGFEPIRPMEAPSPNYPTYNNDLPNNMNGFSTKLLIALISGLGIGAIACAIYIFLNLGKVTISL